MLAEALRATISLALFKTGPQDFPYDQRLMPWLVAATILGNAILVSSVASPLVGALMGAVFVAAVALNTNMLLKMRGVPERFQQTMNSLLAIQVLLSVLMLGPMLKLAPAMAEMLRSAGNDFEQMQAEADKLPVFPRLAMDLLFIWGSAVCINIYRHAANVRLMPAILISVLMSIGVAGITLVVSSIILTILSVGTPA